MFSENSIGTGEGSGGMDARTSRAFHDVLLFRAGADQARRRRGFRAGIAASLAPIKDSSQSFQRGLTFGRIALESTLFLAGGAFGVGVMLLIPGGETQARGGLIAAVGLGLASLVGLLRMTARASSRSSV